MRLFEFYVDRGEIINGSQSTEHISNAMHFSQHVNSTCAFQTHDHVTSNSIPTLWCVISAKNGLERIIKRGWFSGRGCSLGGWFSEREEGGFQAEGAPSEGGFQREKRVVLAQRCSVFMLMCVWS